MKKYEIISERFVWSSEREDKNFKIDGTWDIDVGPDYVTFKTQDKVKHKVPLTKIYDIKIWDESDRIYPINTYESFAPKVDENIDKEIDEFFSNKEKENMLDGKPMDAEMAKIINDNFMDLLDEEVN